MRDFTMCDPAHDKNSSMASAACFVTAPFPNLKKKVEMGSALYTLI